MTRKWMNLLVDFSFRTYFLYIFLFQTIKFIQFIQLKERTTVNISQNLFIGLLYVKQWSKLIKMLSIFPQSSHKWTEKKAAQC